MRRRGRRTRSAMSSTTGTVRIAFAKPPAPVVSCPMQPHASGRVSSSQPRRLPADADLDQHEVGALDGGVEIAGERDVAGEARAVEDPPREAADHLAPLGVDVVQRRGRSTSSSARPDTSSGV